VLCGKCFRGAAGETALYSGTNVGERQSFDGGAEFGGGAGHAVDDAGGLVLGDGVPGGLLELGKSKGAVFAHAGQQQSDAGAGPSGKEAPEEDVDAGAVGVGARLGDIGDAAVGSQDEMVVGRGDEDDAGAGGVALLGDLDGQPGAGVEPSGEAGGEIGGDVLDDDGRSGEIAAQAGQHLRDGFRAAGGGADGEEGRQRDGRGGGTDHGRGAELDFGGFVSRFHQQSKSIQQRLGAANGAVGREGRCLEGVKAAGAESFIHFAEVRADARGDDKDGARRGGHDAAGGFRAVHDRHEQVHQDDVGQVGGSLADSLGAVDGGPRDAVARRGFDDAAQQRLSQRQIVDDGDTHETVPLTPTLSPAAGAREIGCNGPLTRPSPGVGGEGEATNDRSGRPPLAGRCRHENCSW